MPQSNLFKSDVIKQNELLVELGHFNSFYSFERSIIKAVILFQPNVTTTFGQQVLRVKTPVDIATPKNWVATGRNNVKLGNVGWLIICFF